MHMTHALKRKFQRTLHPYQWICGLLDHSGSSSNISSSSSSSNSRRGRSSSLIINRSISTNIKDAFDFKCNTSSNGLPTTGLFGINELMSPSGFKTLERECLMKAGMIESRLRKADVVNASTSLNIINDFDELSDTLCTVIDLSEFIRLLHPSKVFVNAALDACRGLHTYMGQLNASSELAHAIRVAIQKPEFSKLPFDAQRTAQVFMFDFEQSGIEKGDGERQYIASLVGEVMDSGINLLQSANVAVQDITLNIEQGKKLLNDMPSGYGSTIRSGFRPDSLVLYGDESLFHEIVYSSNDSATRKAAFMAISSTPKPTLDLVERMLMLRHKLAQAVGFSTYGHKALKDTMVSGPEAVTRFLTTLDEQLEVPVAAERQRLIDTRRRIDPDIAVDAPIQPWDLPRLMRATRHELDASGKCAIDKIRDYFSVGTCIQGIGTIVEHMYGITLRLVDPEPGEVWHNSVRKLEVMDGTKLLGVMYCDLFRRPEKFSMDAHYTIRCGRRLPDGTYQTPIIAIVCNFPPGSPTLLYANEAENLFHEWGHAMHSMLTEATYHNVAGTRCRMDFVEIPSVLNENFIWNAAPSRHYITNEPAPRELLKAVQNSRQLFAAMELRLQVRHALADQILHGAHPLPQRADAIFSSIVGNSALSPQSFAIGRFSHLVNYGALYYSYPWASSVAATIWRNQFAADPLDRAAGTRYRNKCLRHGGGRDPWEIVEDLVGTRPSMDELVKSIIGKLYT